MICARLEELLRVRVRCPRETVFWGHQLRLQLEDSIEAFLHVGWELMRSVFAVEVDGLAYRIHHHAAVVTSLQVGFELSAHGRLQVTVNIVRELAKQLAAVQMLMRARHRSSLSGGSR
jgi:hypothetical protein